MSFLSISGPLSEDQANLFLPALLDKWRLDKWFELVSKVPEQWNQGGMWEVILSALPVVTGVGLTTQKLLVSPGRFQQHVSLCKQENLPICIKIKTSLLLHILSLFK